LSGPWRDLDSCYHEGRNNPSNERLHGYSFHNVEGSEENENDRNAETEVRVILIPKSKHADAGNEDEDELEEGEVSDVEVLVETIPK
jgi:hypothetical protein